MKILHILNTSRFSGAENVVCQIIGMFREDADVEMLYCSPDGEIREALKERDVRFVPLTALTVKELRRVIAEQKPDVIHAHDMRASYIAARACGKIPLISHIHNNAFDSRGLSVKSVAYLLAAKKAKHIFWVSQSSYEGYFFHNLFSQKSSVLYNIIDIDALYERMNADSAEYRYDVAYVGRLTYPKNPERLLHVFSKVVERLPDVNIAIVGTGELEEEVKALAAELNLQNNVKFLGFMSNPLKLLHDAKAMVMTSRWEGTPMCALEAMALGVPIVSTPVDGLLALIEDGTEGYLSDDDDVLADRIADLARDADLRDKMSRSSLEKAREMNDIVSYRARIWEQYTKLV